MNFSKDFQKLLLSDKEGEFKRNSLSSAASKTNKIVLEHLWAFAKTILNNAELNNFILHTDKEGSNALHLAIKHSNKTVIEYLFRIVFEQLQKDEQKILFQKLGSDSQNIFHCAVLNSEKKRNFHNSLELHR